MNERTNYSELLYQRSGHDIDILEKNAKEYPFSSLASFLLLYHYKKNNHPGFEKLAKKTALHFNNSHWLQFLLSNAIFETEQEIISQENLQAAEPKHASEIKSGSTESFNEQNFRNDEEQASEEKILTENNFEIPQQIHEVKIEAIPETLYDQDLQQEPETLEKEKQFQTDNRETEQEKIVYSEEPLAEEAIAFEPLHTVDYFASQGIKITDEPATTDKLGNQMKSFTQWLKSMKKLHPSKLGEQTSVNEKLIQSAAEESNISTEILTEAMAEVLIKQDKKEKAIEMFSKLSLINPSKSAYFAAKIERIKSS